MPPFTDNRVRQAMRLIVDRQAMLEQVLSGYGRVANDLFSPFDTAYDTDLPQRTQDIEKAKSLLKAAGQRQSGRPAHDRRRGRHGRLRQRVRRSRRRRAGVTVNVHNDPNYYGDQYLKLPFSVDFWGTRNYLPQVANRARCPTSPYNETHWPPKSGPGSKYVEPVQAGAASEVDPSKRSSIIHEMQTLEYNYGRLHHPVLQQPGGLLQHARWPGSCRRKSTQNLDSFGHGYRTIWFASVAPATRERPVAHLRDSSVRRRPARPARARARVGVVFAATQALPGDPARAILGRRRRRPA